MKRETRIQQVGWGHLFVYIPKPLVRAARPKHDDKVHQETFSKCRNLEFAKD
jgi:hypothetical protein